MSLRFAGIGEALVVLAAVGVAACSSDPQTGVQPFAFGEDGASSTSSSGTSMGTGCTLGETFPCTCDDLSQGQQACDANGMLGACACSAAPMMGEAMSNVDTGDGTDATATSESGDPTGAEGIASGDVDLAMTSDGMPADGTMDDTPPATETDTATDPVAETDATGDAETTDPEADSATTSTEDTTTDAVDLGDGSEVPATDLCADAANWEQEWSDWEVEVLNLVNEYRAQGADCGSRGSFQATTALTMNATLRCAARLHSLDMYVRGFFSHDNPDGEDPFDRMAAVGYEGSSMGENIAQGQQSPQDVMEGWMGSDGHCGNIMSDSFTEIGVGYYPGEQSGFQNRNYWTQTFGAQRAQGGGNGGAFGGFQ